MVPYVKNNCVCSTSIRTHRDKLWPTASPQLQSSHNAETSCSPELEPFHRRRFSEVMSPAVWVLGRRAVDCLKHVRRTCPRRPRISHSQCLLVDRLLTRYVPSFLCCVQLLAVLGILTTLVSNYYANKPLFLRLLTPMSVSSGSTKLHILPAIPKKP